MASRFTAGGLRICQKLTPDGFSGPFAGDDAVAGELCGFAVALEEGAVGHDELEVDACVAARGAGDAFDQFVCHDVALGPVIAGGLQGVSVAGQGRIRGHALGHGQEGGQAGHRVRSRTQCHGPLIHGMARTPGD